MNPLHALILGYESVDLYVHATISYWMCRHIDWVS